MWPGEHEELTVWADRLLADGDPLGQLVALGLRVEELRDSAADPTDADSLFEELTDLIERNGEALLGPLASEPALELEWQCGVVREAFPSFPVEAAPLLLPLLAINVDGHHIFGDLAQRAVAHAARVGSRRRAELPQARALGREVAGVDQSARLLTWTVARGIGWRCASSSTRTISSMPSSLASSGGSSDINHAVE